MSVVSVAKEFGVSGVHWDMGVFEMVTRPLEFLSSIKWRPPPLEVQQIHRNSFPPKQGNVTSSQCKEGKLGLFLSCGGTLGVSLVETGISGNFLSCIKGIKDPFEAQEGR